MRSRAGNTRIETASSSDYESGARMLKRSITLTAKQASFLEKEAEQIGITVSDLIRRIIDDYRDKKDK